MKKLTFTSVFSQLLLLLFVIAWIVPTFGLFISSLRDKDVLAISGWWTSFTTTEVNEIYRTKGKEYQIKEGDYYFIKSNLFDENQEVAKAYDAICTPDFFGFNAALELQYRGRFDSTGRGEPSINNERDLYEGMKLIANTQQGPKEQISSIGCSIKWK